MQGKDNIKVVQITKIFKLTLNNNSLQLQQITIANNNYNIYNTKYIDLIKLI